MFMGQPYSIILNFIALFVGQQFHIILVIGRLHCSHMAVGYTEEK